MLARKEAELILQGVTFINQALAGEFPDRTFDSIKSHRKSLTYKQLMQEYTRRLRQVVDQGTPPSPRAPERGLDEGILRFLAELTDLDTREYNAEHLKRICRELPRRPKEDIAVEIATYIRSLFPLAQQRGPRRERPVERNLSKRKQRRIEYAKVQKLYRKNRSLCLRKILKDVVGNNTLPHDLMEPYWRTVMTAESHVTPGVERLLDRDMSSLWDPIKSHEIKNALPDNGTAPGPDGVEAKQLRSVSLNILVRVYNVLLYVGRLPEELMKSRTTMIPKKQEQDSPGDFRPIAVASVVTRVLNKILATRLLDSIPLDDRQKAFRDLDGCAEGIMKLDMVIKTCKSRFRSLFIASIDMRKAFDSVSHQAIFDTLKSFGVPKQLITYLQAMYDNNITKITYDGWESDPIRSTTGVKQGDPLSPIIFNMVVDRMFRELLEEIGVVVDELKVNAIAYADDLILVASTKMGLQELIDKSGDYLDKCGLRMNVDKSMTISVRNVPQKKKTVVDARTTFTWSGHRIPALTAADQWKYLGVPFTPEGRAVTDPVQKLREQLGKLSAAPLKPQQRLFALHTVVTPSLYHLLTFSKIYMSVLKKLDKVTRASIKRWLNLPHDTPTAYFHADVGDGGLGIPSLRWTIPLLRLNRIRNMPEYHPDARPHSLLVAETKQASLRLRDGDQQINTKEELSKRWAAVLYKCTDGKALAESAKVAGQNRWIQDGNLFVNGRDFINMVKLRINALPFRSRTSRGRIKDRRCRAGCNNAETLNHVLQQCPRTHVARVKRHDAVVSYVARALRNRNFTVLEEQHFIREGVLRKPDLVAYQGTRGLVIDGQVVGEQADLDRAHRRKVDYYENLVDDVRARTGAQEIKFTSITLSARGLWSRKSADQLNQLGVITRRDVKVISTKAIVGGLNAFHLFNRATTTRPPHAEGQRGPGPGPPRGGR